jgi:hypothetical protein
MDSLPIISLVTAGFRRYDDEIETRHRYDTMKEHIVFIAAIIATLTRLPPRINLDTKA